MKPSTNSGGTDWRDLYMAALFESDKARMVQRINEAEAEIVKRGRELFVTASAGVDERGALDHALHMLHALKSCLKVENNRRVAA